MSQSELSILLAADDAVECEYPPGFNWRASIEEVRNLKATLEEIAARSFKFDDSVQDASFFAELAIRKPADRVIYTVFGVRFSCFGRLFADYANCPSEQLACEKRNAILNHIKATGFIHISRETLALPYCGSNPAFVGQDWGYRFFSYL